MKLLISISFCFGLLLFANSGNAQAGLPPYHPDSKALYDTIVRMDSIFFEAYNNCRMDVMSSLISENIEFYHDRGGLDTSKSNILASIKKYVCNTTRRELLPGSIEVYPVPNFGAIQIGAHRFHNTKENSTSRYARFITLWRREQGEWRMARVISIH